MYRVWPTAKFSPVDDLDQRFVIRENSHRIHNPFTSEKLATLGRVLYLSQLTFADPMYQRAVRSL